MKNRKTIYFILAAAGALQALYYLQQADDCYSFTFAMGLMITPDSVNYILLSAFPVPMVFLIFSVCGKYQEELKGYGFLLLIRNYSKKKYIVKSDGRFVALVFLYILYLLLPYLPPGNHLKPVAAPAVARAIAVYGLICIILMLLQFILEMFFDPLFVAGCLMLYILMSVFISPYVGGTWLQKVFVPALSMGSLNGSITGDSQYAVNLIYCAAAAAALAVIQTKIFQRKSIV